MDAARARFDALIEQLESGKTLTEDEKADLEKAQSEIAAIAAENVLGNADFIRRLVKGEPSLAEKILNKIVQIKNALTGNSEANAQAAFVRKAEKLYLDAIDELGGTYRDGKIHLANREDDELTRVNDEKMYVSEENGAEIVDESGEVRYNNGEVQYARRQDSLINHTFPTYDKSASEANQLAVRWVHKEYVKTGDKALISYHGRWYLIQKFDSMDLGYLIMKHVKAAEYESYFKEIQENDSNRYVSEILDGIDVGTGEGHLNVGGKSSVDSNDVSEQRGKDQNLLRLVEGQVEQQQGDSQSRTDYARSNADRQGRETGIKFSRKGATDRQTDALVDKVLAEMASKGASTEDLAELRRQIENITKIDEDSKRLNADADSAQEAAAIEAIVSKLKADKEGRKANPNASKTTKSTAGQAAKDHADRNYGKIYTKKDAREIISAALAEHLTFPEDGVFGSLVGKSREQAIEVLWRGLNSAEDIQKRRGAALRFLCYN